MNNSSSMQVVNNRKSAASGGNSSSGGSSIASSPTRRRVRGHKKNKKNLFPHVEQFQDEDNRHAIQLEQILHDRGLYDTEDGLEKRKEALSHLEDLLNRWSVSLRPFALNTSSHNSNTNNNNPDTKKLPRPRVALISFGSYRLGVHRPDADLDLLALCPPNSTRGDFFTSLVKFLKEDDEHVKGVHPIPGAYTPVIKFTLNGLSVDMLFARVADGTKLQRHTKGANYVIDDSDLIDLDEAGVRSLNGSRVAQTLLESIPDIDSYRTTLRAVKEWATVHGLYSNVLGFLGGINYALLVACICRQHPNASPCSLLKAFFETFAKWKWPNPVVLKAVVYQPPQGVTPLAVWDTINNPRDRTHLMPILTPTYPSMNSSYNVGIPQLRRISSELNNACDILKAIEMGGNKEWQDLFKGTDFFKRHLHFLRVNVIATDGESFLEWFRFVESRLRLLIAGLESPMSNIQVVPFAKFYDDATNNSEYKTSLYIALRFGHGVESIDLTFFASDFLRKVEAWNGKTANMNLSIDHLTQQELPDALMHKKEVESVLEDVVVVAEKPQAATMSYAAMVRGEALASPAKRARM